MRLRLRPIVRGLWIPLVVSSAFPVVAVAQSTYTNCTETLHGFSCNSTTVPTFGDSFLRGYEAARRARESGAGSDPNAYDDERQRAMNAQLEAQRRREEIDRQTQPGEGPLWPRKSYAWTGPQLVDEAQSLEQAAAGAYWQQQVDACLRLELSQGRPAEQCIDNLLVTDNYFARAVASIGGTTQVDSYLERARNARRDAASESTGKPRQ